jgi:hypothetical protein
LADDFRAAREALRTARFTRGRKPVGQVAKRRRPIMPSPFKRDLHLQAGPLLQIADHAEQVLRLRIPACAEHADQALRRRAGRLAELLEADRRLDVVAQDGLAGLE